MKNIKELNIEDIEDLKTELKEVRFTISRMQESLAERCTKARNIEYQIALLAKIKGAE